MEMNELDKIVKDALGKLEVDASSNAWQQMEAKIEADADLSGATQQSFDDAIKGAIESTEVAYTPGLWAMMEARIEADAELSGATEQVFDESIKNAIGSKEVAYTASAWAMMEAHLDLEENLVDIEDTDVIDAVSYSNLSNLQVEYDEESWNTLSKKLDKEFSFRRRVLYRYKVLEMALMALFIFTLFNTLPLQKELVQKLTDKNNIEKTTNSFEKEDSSEQLIAANEPTPKETAVNTSKEETEVSKINKSTATKDNNIQYSIIENQSNIVSTPITTSIENSTIENKLNASNSSESIEAKIANATPSLEFKKVEGFLSNNKLSIMSSLPSLATRFFFIQDETKPILECILCKGAFTPLKIKTGMFMVGDYNYVMTPYDRDFNLSSYNNATLGYGLGFTLGFGFGRWEVETGGIYASKRYQPESEEVLGDFRSGYIENKLDEITLDIIKIPLNIKYTFTNKPNWNFYAMAGASLNVAASAKYNTIATYKSPAPPPGFGGRSSEEIIESESKYNNKIFSDGWFEGGSFLENRYFTANIGLGMERQLTKRWSLFMQKSYQHSILFDGIGPNKDRINNVSIFAGARATLK